MKNYLGVQARTRGGVFGPGGYGGGIFDGSGMGFGGPVFGDGLNRRKRSVVIQ